VLLRSYWDAHRTLTAGKDAVVYTVDDATYRIPLL
jgi:hypothetical protein